MPPSKDSRAATLCRQTKLVGRQSFAAKQGVSACRLQPPPVGMGMPTYIKAVTLCRQTKLVGRQPFAAGQSVNACRLQTPLVGMGMPTYIKAAILCRQTRRQRLQVANPACRHGDADLHIDVSTDKHRFPVKNRSPKGCPMKRNGMGYGESW